MTLFFARVENIKSTLIFAVITGPNLFVGSLYQLARKEALINGFVICVVAHFCEYKSSQTMHGEAVCNKVKPS